MKNNVTTITDATPVTTTATTNNDYDDDDEYVPTYEKETISILNKYTFEVFTVVPPPIEYMMTLHNEDCEISGRQVWCGSYLLAAVLCNGRNEFNAKRVLELGSGTGILGMVVSKLITDRGCVAITDGDEAAVSLLESNLRNGTNEMNDEIIKCHVLQWGTATSTTKFESWCQSCWPTLFRTPQKVVFDTIIAGDVLYKSNLPKLFFQTVVHYLASNGVLYLCHVPRAGITHDRVVQEATTAGFLQIQEIPVTDEMIRQITCIQHEDIIRAKVYRMTFDSS